MSSHDMTLRSTLTLKPTVTLAHVVEALKPLLNHLRIGIDATAPVPDRGAVPFDVETASIELNDDGRLEISLDYYGHGHEAFDAEADLACAALNGIVLGGGALEFVDHDTSPGNSEAIGVRFVGEDDRAAALARIDYGFELARPWFEGVISNSLIATLMNGARAAVGSTGSLRTKHTN